MTSIITISIYIYILYINVCAEITVIARCAQQLWFESIIIMIIRLLNFMFVGPFHFLVFFKNEIIDFAETYGRCQKQRHRNHYLVVKTER